MKTENKKLKKKDRYNIRIRYYCQRSRKLKSFGRFLQEVQQANQICM